MTGTRLARGTVSRLLVLSGCAYPRARGEAAQKGRLVWAVVLSAAPLGLAGCAATIKTFTVTPHEVCPGTPVDVAWETQGGSARVTTRPPLSPRSGHTYAPTSTTTFVITVKPFLGKPKSKETAATVYAGTVSQPEPSEIGFKTTCQGGIVSAILERPFAEWDPRLIVESVATEEGREVAVGHGGKEATLTAQQPSTEVFNGTTLGGAWSVTVPLVAPENCDGTGATPPDLIILTAHVRCGS